MKISIEIRRIHSGGAAIKLLVNLVQASPSPELLTRRTATAAHLSAKTRRAASSKFRRSLSSTEPNNSELDLTALSESIAPPGGSLSLPQVFVRSGCRLAERLISVRGASPRPIIPTSCFSGCDGLRLTACNPHFDRTRLWLSATR